MVTVTRKLFTMLLSVFWFDHRLNVGQWISVLLVFVGIGLEVGVRQMEWGEKKKGGTTKKANGYRNK